MACSSPTWAARNSRASRSSGSRTSTELYTPIIGYRQINFTQQEPITGADTVSGLRLVDARASYGIGLETFALGFPIHFDWSWKTLFNKDWEDLMFAASAEAARSASRSSRSGSDTTSKSFGSFVTFGSFGSFCS